MQMMQMDPRYMEVFKVMTGIDLGSMQEDMARNKDKQEEQDKINAA